MTILSVFNPFRNLCFSFSPFFWPMTILSQLSALQIDSAYLGKVNKKNFHWIFFINRIHRIQIQIRWNFSHFLHLNGNFLHYARIHTFSKRELQGKVGKIWGQFSEHTKWVEQQKGSAVNYNRIINAPSARFCLKLLDKVGLTFNFCTRT